VIGKFIDGSDDSDGRAEQALRKALELNPHLTLAHKYYAHLEAETGQPRAALVRLVGEAKRHGNDPELFAGLVHACRYCGLFEQAIAAHEEARRLDPNVPSSIEQTVLMTGDVDRLLAIPRIASATGSDSVIDVIGLGLAGRRDQALVSLAEHRRQAQLDIFHAYADTLLAWLERRPADMRTNVAALDGLKIMNDPEAMFQEGWLLCDVGEHAEGMSFLRRAIDKGYTVATTLAGGPAFDALRGDAAFRQLLADAESGRQQALADFRESGGERLLGR
jgi:tetratricopeptide (TPR) repeat protein